MPFIPLQNDVDHARVSPQEQAKRDEGARQIVASEIESEAYDPDVQQALKREHSRRFGGEPPAAGPRGFVPLATAKDEPASVGLAPVDANSRPAEPGKTSVLRNVLMNNPLTAIGETALNLGTMGVAMPLAGLAGLGTMAGRALGFTDRNPVDVVHGVSEGLTYAPRGEMGQAATAIATYPFEKLAEAGQYAGGKTLDATGSPVLATAIDTAINVLPMGIGPAAKLTRRATSRPQSPAPVEPIAAEKVTADASRAGAEAPAQRQGAAAVPENAVMADTAPAQRGFTPVDTAVQTPDVLPPTDITPHLAAGVQELTQIKDAGVSVPDALTQAGIHSEIYSPEARQLAGFLADNADSPQKLAAFEATYREALAAEELTAIPERSPHDAATAKTPQMGRPGEDAPLVEAGGRQSGNAPGREGGPQGGGVHAEGVSKFGEVSTPAERGATNQARSDARYTLVDAEELRPSHDVNLRQHDAYPEQFKRPDWSRADAEQRVQDIVKDFDPARLAESVDDGAGAPMMARDGTVEAGNARAIAIQRVYQANGEKAAGYRQFLRDNADRLGIDAAEVDAINRPVLVRVPDEPAPRGSGDWIAFPPETGTLGIPRAEMPQIVGEHRGALVQFLKGRGIENKMIEVPAETLKPTQAEFSVKKAAKWQEGGKGGDRSVLASSDGYILDGHHQWVAARALGEPVKVIQFDATIRELLPAVDAFPSAKRAEGATASTAGDMPAEGKVNAMAPGANYVGFVNDAPKPGALMPDSATAKAPTRPEPIRREDILIPFAKALGTGIYEGRIKGKGVMGHFRPKLEEVRIKRHADLETSAHELAHLIDHRVPEIRKTWSSGKDWQVHREELRGLSYDRTKIYEGFAEFVRHYMTQPDVAKTRAPTFYQWFEDFAARHEYGPAITKAQKGMTDWFNQDAIDRARSKIGDHRPMTDALDGKWDSFRQATVDDLHGVYRMERELTGNKIAPNGPYESARLSRASYSIADGAVRFGAPLKKADGSYGWQGKGLEEILRPVSANLNDALLYFVGRSSRELMVQGREHLFTVGEVDAMLKLKRPEFDQAFKEYQAWNSAVMDFAEASGVINPQSRAQWQRLDYLPFHRVGSPDGFKGKAGDWSGVKALTGGTENLRDILGNMTANAALLIDKAVKNEARLKIAALAEQEGGGKFMIKIPAESRPVKVASSAVVDSILKAMGLDKAAADSPAAAKAADRLRKLFEKTPAMLELMQTNMPPSGGNVVAVLKEGKPIWYEVNDPILLRALESIDRAPPPWIVKWLGLPKRIGQASIVVTPDFMIANIARDTIMGSVMSRTGFKPVLDSLKGMRLRLTNDPIYKEFIANGGGLSSMYLEETRLRTKLERFYGKQGIDYRTVLDAPHKLLGFIETLGDAFEMSTRLGEYKRAVDAGEHPRHAAYLGRDVSTDFAMRGDNKALGFMYDTVMFLKPALVSWDRLYRGLAHDPNKGAIATKAGVMALMSTSLYLLNRDDLRYQDLPDWDRDTHWHFFIGDQHFRYPKIWEIGAIASAAERTAEKIVDGDPAGLGKDFARILGQTFGVNLMPQIIAPLYQQATNRNGFTRSPIETPGMENQQPFMRAKPTTSETMKAAGMATSNLPETLQVNPVRAEALLRGYFNTWAVYGLALSDKAFFSDKSPTTRTDQLPVVRRFYSEEPPLHTKYETQFYDMLGEAKRLHGSLRELDKIGRSDIADQKETEPMAAEAKPLEHAAKNLQSINQEMRKIRRGDTSPDEKRDSLDKLTIERNDLLKRAVLDSKASTKDKAH